MEPNAATRHLGPKVPSSPQVPVPGSSWSHAELEANSPRGWLPGGRRAALLSPRAVKHPASLLVARAGGAVCSPSVQGDLPQGARAARTVPWVSVRTHDLPGLFFPRIAAPPGGGVCS